MTSEGTTTSGPQFTRFTILHVCTGNIGRSPMAERLMVVGLARRLSNQAAAFSVSSAGTQGCEGLGMEPYSETVLRERGVDASGFVARELTPSMVEGADLVLTATQQHRAHVVGLVPAQVRRCFTLKEFARLGGLVQDAERPTGAVVVRQSDSPTAAQLQVAARARVDLAGRIRGLADRLPPGADDIEDPIGAPLLFYAARAEEINDACGRAVDLLLGLDHDSGADRSRSARH